MVVRPPNPENPRVEGADVVRGVNFWGMETNQKPPDGWGVGFGGGHVWTHLWFMAYELLLVDEMISLPV